MHRCCLRHRLRETRATANGLHALLFSVKDSKKDLNTEKDVILPADEALRQLHQHYGSEGLTALWRCQAPVVSGDLRISLRVEMWFCRLDISDVKTTEPHFDSERQAIIIIITQQRTISSCASSGLCTGLYTVSYELFLERHHHEALCGGGGDTTRATHQRSADLNC